MNKKINHALKTAMPRRQGAGLPSQAVCALAGIQKQDLLLRVRGAAAHFQVAAAAAGAHLLSTLAVAEAKRGEEPYMYSSNLRTSPTLP